MKIGLTIIAIGGFMFFLAVSIGILPDKYSWLSRHIASIGMSLGCIGGSVMAIVQIWKR